jgi:hypothetical protein
MTSLTYVFQESLYKEIIKEDGVIEYLTAFLLLISSVFLFSKVIKIGYSRGYPWFIFNVLMVLGLFFGFGEELSWGQRIFSIESSDLFLNHNSQDEINIHNLTIRDISINKLIFSYGFSIIFGVYFLLLLNGYKKNKRINNIVDKIGIPLPKIKHSIFFVGLSCIIFIIPDCEKWELWECLFVLFFFLILVEPYNSSEKLLLTKNNPPSNKTKNQMTSSNFKE